MFRILCWLALDILFTRISITLWNESDGQITGYLIFCVAAVVFFTWELIRSVKDWLK